mmetsp:Transcript_20202/g.57346  ORF Transcript_20202/g.57346 Transcript_20202/m.57346 type:complete len:286 (-) Transcript_20202:341-1198(-)
MKFQLTITTIAALASTSAAFTAHTAPSSRPLQRSPAFVTTPSPQPAPKAQQSLLVRYSSSLKDSIADFKFASAEERKKVIDDLVADDEWNGFGMELSENVRKTIVEDIEKFTGNSGHEMGDITREVDQRVKDQVKTMREKGETGLDDLVQAMDETSKSIKKEITGKTDEAEELSESIEKSIKDTVDKFTGKVYEVGDIAKSIDSRVKDKASEFIDNAEHEFSDVAKEIEERRQKWAKEYLGDDAAANYKFGDITKNALSNWTGKDHVEFEDITDKLFGGLTSEKK